MKKVYQERRSNPLCQILLLGPLILGLKINHWHTEGISDFNKSGFGDGVKSLK